MQHREAPKVFLEVWNLFLQKKVPRLERSVNTEGEAVKSKRTISLCFNQQRNSYISSANLADFSGLIPEKSQTPFLKLTLTKKLGVYAPSFSVNLNLLNGICDFFDVRQKKLAMVANRWISWFDD